MPGSGSCKATRRRATEMSAVGGGRAEPVITLITFIRGHYPRGHQFVPRAKGSPDGLATCKVQGLKHQHLVTADQECDGVSLDDADDIFLQARQT